MNYKKEINGQSALLKKAFIRIVNDGMLVWDNSRSAWVSTMVDGDDKVSILANALVERSISNNKPSEVIGTVLQAEMVAAGPKIFEFSSETLELLENVELTFPATDYRQPFQTFCVDIPKDYAKNRLVPCTDDLMNDFKHVPDYAIIRHCRSETENNLWFCLFMDSGFYMTQFLRLRDGVSLEDCWKFENCSPEEMGQSEKEQELTRLIWRSICNIAQLAVENGIVRQPDQHLDKLTEKLSRMPAKHREGAMLDIATRAQFYKLKQEIVLRKNVIQMSRSTMGDRVVKPHWRRGHWRMQPHGEKRSFHKKVFISSVFVNYDIFDNHASRTMATYTEGPNAKTGSS